jgi:ribosomal protein L12E/L44/L45/RPP1/RPP2
MVIRFMCPYWISLIYSTVSIFQGGLTAQQRLERRMQKFAKAAAAVAPPSGSTSSADSAPAPAEEEDGEEAQRRRTEITVCVAA